MKRALWALLAVSSMLAGEARAVVVAGANGGAPANNTTAAQMAGQLGLGDTGFFASIVPYSGAGAVYLGWATTGVGNRAFALSAMHITFTNLMVVDGLTFNVARQSILGSDLALLTLTHATDLMPGLPVMPLAAATPAIGTDVIMAGFGQDRIQAATTNSASSDAVAVADGTGYSTVWASSILRWGTNQTADIDGNPSVTTNVGGLPTVVIKTIFDQPDPGQWLSTSEAQAVLGDSGGGMFDFDGNLLGLIVSVSGNDVTDAAFDEATWFADVASYKGDIETTIGYTLVPEPPTMALLGVAALAAVILRRRVVR